MLDLPYHWDMSFLLNFLIYYIYLLISKIDTEYMNKKNANIVVKTVQQTSVFIL